VSKHLHKSLWNHQVRALFKSYIEKEVGRLEEQVENYHVFRSLCRELEGEDLLLSRQMIRTLAKRTQTLLISIDWAAWYPPLGRHRFRA
jgi:hypothetical protein